MVNQEARENNNKTQGTSGDFRYLIVKPQNGGLGDLVRFLRKKDVESCVKFLEVSDDGVLEEELLGATLGDDGETPDHRWVIFVSIVARKVITMFKKPMEWFGYLVEFFLNLLSLNGGFLGLPFNLLRGRVVVPVRGSETFISMIGHLDGRIDLYGSETLTRAVDEVASMGGSFQAEVGSRMLMDLCIMASKLAYENAKVVENVVNLHWKMHFVDFYNCWNDYQQENSTQVFILCDKPKDANFIVISFRGTEPFDADDWSTDFDYSWYEIPKLGKVHMGFLEALGLGNRMEASTFLEQLLLSNGTKPVVNLNSSEETTELSSALSDPNVQFGSERSSDSKLQPQMGEQTAYYTVRSRLKELFKEHKDAKFVVTGHSLGGALAILFPIVLHLHEEKEVLDRMLAVYTFGQPRIGNRQLGRFMEAHLDHPASKYFRVVYCNDLVPRLPYDDKTFLYKHFGKCLYYNSFYIEQEVDEEPNPNYFGVRFLIPEYLTAVWELIRSFLMHYIYGAEYKERWESILFRIGGLALPGLADHCPVNYVNSVRLGRERVIRMSPLETM